MKTMTAIIATAMLLGACASGDGMMRLGRNCPAPKGNEVPSGCQVPGFANYWMSNSGAIVQVANPKTVREMLRTSRSPNLGGM